MFIGISDIHVIKALCSKSLEEHVFGKRILAFAVGTFCLVCKNVKSGKSYSKCYE